MEPHPSVFTFLEGIREGAATKCKVPCKITCPPRFRGKDGHLLASHLLLPLPHLLASGTSFLAKSPVTFSLGTSSLGTFSLRGTQKSLKTSP
jgi:hypothetical protein